MKIEIIMAIILTLGIFVLSVIKLKGFNFNAKSLSRIGIVSAISIVLYTIKLVPFPQGGGFSLLAVLPIMILSYLVGIEEAVLAAIIVGTLKAFLIPPIHPLQIPLDYLGSSMAIGFTAIFGTGKFQLTIGAVVSGLVSILFYILSGVIFYSQFTPEGMNIWKYSIGYNFLGYGVEVLLSIIVLNVLPLKSLKRTLI